MESVATLLDLLTRPEFLAGIVAGVVGLAILLLVPETARERVADWGLLLSAAILIAINLAVARRLGLVAGIAVLAAGGWALNRSATAFRIIGWLTVASGAVIVSLRGGLPDRLWLQVLTVAVTLVAGTALATWSRDLPHHLLGPMFAIGAFGIWATVPETEMARAVLGAAIPMAVATMQPIEARLFAPGAYALAGLAAWVAAVGGAARPASIIGGWACLGLLVILPYCRPSASDLLAKRPWTVLVVHAVVVLVSSRVIGLWESTIPAMLAAAILAGITYLALGYFLTGKEETT